MEQKNSYVFYETFYDMLKELPPETRLKFYDAISVYGLFGEEPDFTGIEKALWNQIKFGIDGAKERYRNSVENGKKGGRPSKNLKENQVAVGSEQVNSGYEIDNEINPEKPSHNPEKPRKTDTKPNKTPNVNVNVNVNDNVNDNDNDNVNENVSLAVDTAKRREPNKKTSLVDREPVNDIEQVEKAYLLNYKSLYDRHLVKTEKPVINWGQSRNLTRSAIDNYGLQNILLAIEHSKDSEFCVQKGYTLTTILSSGVLAGLINGNNWKKEASMYSQDHPENIEDYGEILF